MDILGKIYSYSFSNGWWKLLYFLLIVNLFGCSAQNGTLIQPTGIAPFLYDDGDLTSLKTALNQHHTHLQQAADTSPIGLPEKITRSDHLSKALAKFISIFEATSHPVLRDKAIKENFDILQARGRQSKRKGQMLVTGYYEPLLQGSLTRKAPYVYPLYLPPKDLHEYTNIDGETQIGRIDSNGVVVPYWTRAEIDSTNVLAGNELVYLKDDFDAFLLHVQGSGKIELRNGTIKNIQYRTNNGHNYSSIGKLLVDENKLLLKDVDMPAIRHYLRQNPQERSRIFNHNKRYIFFGWGDENHPRGSIGAPLTPERSIAIDKKSLPLGTICYLVSRRPVIDETGQITTWETMHRFVVAQDTGSAIRGPGRVDFFWGNGNYAEIAAGAMKEEGKLYFLISKEPDGRN